MLYLPNSTNNQGLLYKKDPYREGSNDVIQRIEDNGRLRCEKPSSLAFNPHFLPLPRTRRTALRLDAHHEPRPQSGGLRAGPYSNSAAQSPNSHDTRMPQLERALQSWCAACGCLAAPRRAGSCRGAAHSQGRCAAGGARRRRDGIWSLANPC